MFHADSWAQYTGAENYILTPSSPSTWTPTDNGMYKSDLYSTDTGDHHDCYDDLTLLNDNAHSEAMQSSPAMLLMSLLDDQGQWCLLSFLK